MGTDPFGPGTIKRPWEDGTNSVDNALRRMDVAFEFMTKLGNPYWCFHDRDIAPEGATLAESHKNLDALVARAKDLQKATGIKLLWGTANLFSNPRFMNGASTNPDAHVLAYAAAQVKKAMEVTLELGGEGYVFWGGRGRLHVPAQHRPRSANSTISPSSCAPPPTTRRKSASRESCSSSPSPRNPPSTSTTSTPPR